MTKASGTQSAGFSPRARVGSGPWLRCEVGLSSSAAGRGRLTLGLFRAESFPDAAICTLNPTRPSRGDLAPPLPPPKGQFRGFLSPVRVGRTGFKRTRGGRGKEVAVPVSLPINGSPPPRPAPRCDDEPPTEPRKPQGRRPPPTARAARPNCPPPAQSRDRGAARAGRGADWPAAGARGLMGRSWPGPPLCQWRLPPAAETGCAVAPKLADVDASAGLCPLPAGKPSE